MYLLSCPSCGVVQKVTPAQAGGQVVCPACGELVRIPKLGDLRQLPQADAATAVGTAREPGSPLRRFGFVAFGLVGIAGLLVAGFCLIRWALIEVPTTTEQHIAELRDTYANVSASQLVIEYEDIEQFGVDLASPMAYQAIVDNKSAWGRNALYAGIVGLLAIAAAGGLAAVARRRPESVTDT